MLLLVAGLVLGWAAQEAPKVDQAQVDAAIKRGVRFLKDQPLPVAPRNRGEHDMSSDDLVLWTYVHAGVPARDPDFEKLFDRMMAAKLETTYRVALQAMILEELDRVTYQWRIAQCAQFLVDNQGQNGQWSYGSPSLFVRDIPTGSRGRPDVATQGGDSKKTGKPKVRRKIRILKRRPGPEFGDNSNSQYAALGLRACYDAGILLPKEVILRAKRWWEQSQHQDGGWGYNDAGMQGAYGSMTAGALGSLVIYEHMLRLRWKNDRRVQRGLQWLAKHFSVEENPKHERWYYYYMYGLERAGVLYGTERVGSHWWYAEGAKVLLARQRRNGAWGRARGRGSSEAIWDTCFAILFLRRATRPFEDVATGGRKK